MNLFFFSAGNPNKDTNHLTPESCSADRKRDALHGSKLCIITMEYCYLYKQYHYNGNLNFNYYYDDIKQLQFNVCTRHKKKENILCMT